MIPPIGLTRKECEKIQFLIARWCKDLGFRYDPDTGIITDKDGDDRVNSLVWRTAGAIKATIDMRKER